MKMMKEAKQVVREQYEKVWDSEKMVEHCVKSVSGYTMIGDVMVTAEKPSIKTDFWFGEHTYDYDEVCEEASRASESEQYFIRENLWGCSSKNLLDALNGRDSRGYDTSFDVYVIRGKYYSQDDDCKLGYVQALRFGTDPEEYFATRNGTQDYRPLTDDEKDQMREFLEGEVEKFRKRLNTYLKRYGLTKCHYGVYWADR